MRLSFELYRGFVDELLTQTKSPLAIAVIRMAEGHAEPTPHLPPSLLLLSGKLPLKDMRVLANALQRAHMEGMSAVISCLSERIARDELRLVQDGTELQIRPYASDLADDWGRRCDGVAWPASEE